MRAPELLAEVAVRPPAGGQRPRLLPVPGYVDDSVLPVEFLPQSYIRDVLLGDDRMEPREIKLYG